jgi:type IV secretion system protein VirD4
MSKRVSRPEVCLLLDEAARLGHLEIVDSALDEGRAFGIRLILCYQSVAQLLKCFPEGQDQTVLANVTQIFFGVNDVKTAEYCSTRLGEATILVKNTSYASSVSRQESYGAQAPSGPQYTENRSTSFNQQGRKLLKPEEVMTLDPRQAITFVPGMPPICTRLVRYYEEPGFFRGGWLRTALRKIGVAFHSLLFLVCSVATAALVSAAILDHTGNDWFREQVWPALQSLDGSVGGETPN